MGIFSKLFGGGKSKEAETQVIESVECPHAVLVSRWDSVKDMGHEDRATRFMCEACHKEFSPEEATKIRETIAERMAASLDELRDETESKTSS